MSAHIRHQIIADKGGKPAFVVVPFDEYLAMVGEASDGGLPDDDVTVPVEVARAHLVDGVSLIRAWREHLGLTQEEVSVRMGVSRSGYSQMERPDQRHRRSTLQKIASALGVMVEQLTD